MDLRRPLVLLAAPLLLLAACGGDDPPAAAAEAGSRAAAKTLADVQPAADAPVHPVACGCALEAVGHCSEWIEIDGEYVALELPVDLGPMPFCKKDGLKARVEGAVEGKTFVATAFEYAD